MRKLRAFCSPRSPLREYNEHGVVMSLILDALNRSQAERGHESDVPGIETQHWVDSPPSAQRLQRALPWVALVMALVVIVWLLFSRNGEPVQVPVAVSSPVSAQTRAEARPSINQAERADVAVPTVSSPQKEVPVVSQTPAPAPAENSAVAKREALPEASTGNNAAVEDLYSTAGGGETSVAVAPIVDQISQPKQQPIDKPVSKPQDNEQTIDIEKMVNLARRETENAELSEHSAKFLSQLSQQSKDQVPTIYYTQHDYSSTASQSSVTLNGKLVRVGGSVGGNIKLLEILPSSIVLSDRGTEFRLRALNSWINL
jgi:general secretion pathway protein B